MAQRISDFRGLKSQFGYAGMHVHNGVADQRIEGAEKALLLRRVRPPKPPHQIGVSATAALAANSAAPASAVAGREAGLVRLYDRGRRDEVPRCALMVVLGRKDILALQVAVMSDHLLRDRIDSPLDVDGAARDRLGRQVGHVGSGHGSSYSSSANRASDRSPEGARR